MFTFALALLPLFAFAQPPTCTIGLEPCFPQDNTGVCDAAPSQPCLTDPADGMVYCCLPDPNATTAPPTTTRPTVPTVSTRTTVPTGTTAPAAITTTRPTSSTCFDVATSCSSNLDLCSSYPAEMGSLCAFTCGFCSATATPPHPVTPPKPACIDKVVNCKKNAALCVNAQYSYLMMTQCPYTCGYCRPCEDYAYQCATWAKNGFCTNPYYSQTDIMRYCARSCGYCGDPATTATNTVTKPPDASCYDRNSNCPTWVKRNFCSNEFYTMTMREYHCAKSCNFC